MVFYMVFPIDHGQSLGLYEDELTINGEYMTISSPFKRQSVKQRVVRDDSYDNDYIKVTASPNSFIAPYLTTSTVTLTLNIDHGTYTIYDRYDVLAKYLITTEPDYDLALAANPLSSWASLNIPANNNTNTGTGVTFSDKPLGVYYIHWYVESGDVYAHSLNVDSPPRLYGGFGPYRIVVPPEIIISAPPVTCPGTTLDLSTSIVNIDWSECSPAAPGSWTLNGSYLDPSSTLSYSQNGGTLAYIINADCGTFSSNTVSITLRNKPIFTAPLATPGAVCEGSTLTLTSPTVNWNYGSPVGAGTWVLNDDVIDGTTPMIMDYDGGTLTY
jgi:hypothetical protein